MRTFLTISALILLPAQLAWGFPELHPPLKINEVEEEKKYDFQGIIRLSNCSASLVRFADNLPSDKAYVLTNGHCVKFIKPNSAIINKPSRKTMQILSPSGSFKGSVKAEMLVYATMTKTDLAIYRLRSTYKEIKARFNATPLTLASEPAPIGTEIEVISGYWRRGYSCLVETYVNELREGRWTFINSLRYSRPGCNVIGGTSGSPVVNARTRDVIAVNNTINANGRKCSRNNPCEIDESGNITYQKGFGYAQQTFWLYNCRNDDGKIDVSTEGCMLKANSRSF